MGNKLVYQCGRPSQVTIKGSVTGKTYMFRKCQPGLHEHECPVTEVDDADAAGLVAHAIAECKAKPFMPTIAPKADHDGAFLRFWQEYQGGKKVHGQPALDRWFEIVHEERKK